MRLDFNAFKLIQPNKNNQKEFSGPKEVMPVVQPAKTTIQKIIKALTGDVSMNVLEIVDCTGISQPTVYRTLGCMIAKGLAIKTPPIKGKVKQAARFNLTGADVTEIMQPSRPKPRAVQKNNKSGLAGVHFNKATSRWITTYGRGKNYPFNNLLDAVCKRKSLEVN